MQIVFMNRLSRMSGVDQEVFAQLWIGEEEGYGVWAGATSQGNRKWVTAYGMKAVHGMKCCVCTGMSLQ